MARSRILGTGHYVPPRVVTNFDVMKMMETTNEFIVRRTGIERRRHADPDVSASDLAVPACQAAVKDAGLTMEEIDLLVLNTITPDHADPGCAFFLQPKLGLSGIPVLDIKQQCAGMLYALAIADQGIKAGAYRHVLIACSEVLSTRIDGSNEGRNIAILFGDGAGAVVVGPGDDDSTEHDTVREGTGRGILSTILHADGSGAKVLYTEAPGSALPRTEHLVVEDIETGRVHFRMIGSEVFENGVTRMSESVFECLEANNLTMDDIDVLIPHQANLRMLEAVIETTGFPEEKTFQNVVDLGNTASATLPIALDQARRAGKIQPGSLCMLVAFGSGFVWGSALVRM